MSFDFFPYQTDPFFSEAHNKEGCYFQSIGRIAWEEGAFRTNNVKEEVQRAALICMEGSYITERFHIVAPEHVFLVFGLVVKYTDRWEPAERVTQEGERAILRMVYKDMEHFVVEAGHNKVGWDPWSASGSLTGKNGHVADKRVFKIIGKLEDVEAKLYG